MRGSHDRGRGLGRLHPVSAWDQANWLVLAVTASTAIPEPLRMLCLKSCIVTLNAMGCQKTIARRIREQVPWQTEPVSTTIHTRQTTQYLC